MPSATAEPTTTSGQLEFYPRPSAPMRSIQVIDSLTRIPQWAPYGPVQPLHGCLYRGRFRCPSRDLLPLRDFDDGLPAAGVGDEGLQFLGFGVCDPSLASAGAYERRDIANDDDPRLEVHGESGGPGFLLPSTQWASSGVFGHHYFLCVLRSDSKCSRSGR